MPTLLKSFVYPTLCLLPVMATIWQINKHPESWVYTPIVYLLLLAVVLLVEHFLPWKDNWNHSTNGDLSLDLKHLAGNLLVSHTSALLYATTFPARALMSPSSLSNWSIPVQYLIGILVFDFGLYAVHRLSHKYGLLWRLHSIHHSSERIYSINGQKRHLLHEVAEGMPGLLCLFILGIRPEVTVLILFTVSVHLLFQHANIDYQAGPLNRVFSVAELHRWHHQRSWQDVQGNYGAIFSFWDSLLGTKLHVKNNPPAEVGLDDDPTLATSSYLEQHIRPFRRDK